MNDVTTEFLLDGANVVAETKNGSTTNYIRGLTGIISSSIQGTNNTTKYYTSDGHGNITKLTDSSGSVVKTYVYDAFGVEQNIDSNDTNPFRYCGEYYDSEIGQIYLRARYYNPEIGRFTQQDPAMEDGYNWYVYCGNEPVNKIDISGFGCVYIRDLVNSLLKIFGGSPVYTVTDNNSIKIQVGNKEFGKNGEFYYDGYAEVYNEDGSTTCKKIGVNDNGYLYVDPELFYKSMGLKVIVQNYTYEITGFQSTLWNIASIATSTIATWGISNLGYGIVAGILTDYLSINPEPGNYMLKNTFACAFNPETGLYKILLTTETYIMRKNEKGEAVYVEAKKPVTVYLGEYDESYVS